jgi:hypothetical protein
LHDAKTKVNTPKKKYNLPCAMFLILDVGWLMLDLNFNFPRDALSHKCAA